MSTTLDIVDIRRVALALGVTESRVLRAAGELHLREHRINGRAFIDAGDEDRIRQLIESKRSK